MPKTVTWASLVRDFGPTEPVPPYGECVVIPGEKWDPDIEALLPDEYVCSFVDLRNKPVTLIHKPQEDTLEHSEEPDKTIEETVTPPAAESSVGSTKGPRTFNPRRWLPADDEKLLREWPNQKGTAMQKAAALVTSFPGRHAGSIYQHYWLLTSKFSRRASKPVSEHKDEQKPKTGNIAKGMPHWSPADIDQLISLWKAGTKRSEIQKEFPDRTPKSVVMMLRRLKKQGKIERRGTRGRLPLVPPANVSPSVNPASSICPSIALCEELVDQITAEEICRGTWQACEFTQHLLIKKRPREWA